MLQLLSETFQLQGFSFKDVADPLHFAPEGGIEARLFHDYHLERWSRIWSPQTLKEVLRILQYLDCYRGPMPRTLQCWVDIEVGHWQHAGALAAFLENRCGHGPLEVNGLAHNAFQMDLSLRSPISYGQFFAESCSVEDLTFKYQFEKPEQWNGEADIISWFFPKIGTESSVLAYLFQRLRKRGVFFLVVETHWQWEVIKGLISRCGREGITLEGFSEFDQESGSAFFSAWRVR